MGFNIEVKYPGPHTKEVKNLLVQSPEINQYVDSILQCIYDHASDRNIMFSSFHPDICLLLSLKQPNYPVFFLTTGGRERSFDYRCDSLRGAARFAKQAGLIGVVTHCTPILRATKLIKAVKEMGLLLFTYGEGNNNIDNVKLQKKCGIDAVIVVKFL